MISRESLKHLYSPQALTIFIFNLFVASWAENGQL